MFRASFRCIILSTFDSVLNSNFSIFFAISHFWWPFRLFDYLFWKAHSNSVILIYYSPYFIKNFDLLSKFLTSDDLWASCDNFFWKVDFKSVILIFKFPTLRKIWNLTQNDPKFETWYLTGNFFFCLIDHFEAWLKSRNWQFSRKMVTKVLKGYVFQKKIEKKRFVKFPGFDRDPGPNPGPGPGFKSRDRKSAGIPIPSRCRPLVITAGGSAALMFAV